MFNPKTLTEADILARDLTARGIRLSPVSESPLQTLCSSSMSIKKVFTDTTEVRNNLVKNSELIDLEGKNKHSVLMTQFTWGLSESLNTSISIARNEVNPMILECVDLINFKLNDGLVWNTGIRIEPVFMYDILKKGNLEELVDKYKSHAVRRITWGVDVWPVMTPDYLRSSAKDKNRSLDSQIDSLLKDLDDSLLLDIYNYLFREYPLEVHLKGVNCESLIEILGFLWSDKWLRDIPDGINLPLETLRVNLTDLKANCGKKINDRLIRFERMCSQKNFILKLPNLQSGDKVFLVQGEIYNQWLKESGTPETLIGHYLSGESGSLINFTSEEEKRYIHLFRLDVDIRRQEFNLRKGSLITKIVSDYVDESIIDLKADKTIVRKRFNEKVKSCPYDENGDLNKWLRKIICYTFFPNTDALEILKNIDSILENSPEMAPREAATLATVSLVSDWLYSAIQTEKV